MLENLKGPFVIDKDNQYYHEAMQKMKEVIELLKKAGADEKLIHDAYIFKRKLGKILIEYYKGNLVDAQVKMKNLIKEICRNDASAVGNTYRCSALKEGKADVKMPLFRARLDAENDGFKADEMGAVPFSMRSIIDTKRFSLPGFPCLYLGNTTYVCWLEMDQPADHRFNASVVYIDKNIHLFDMTVTISDLVHYDEEQGLTVKEGISIGMIRRFMLVVCSSFRVKEGGRHFKSEYIIPQLIMLACKKYGCDGVIYISTRIANADFFKVSALNIALYSGYPNNRFNPDSDETELTKNVDIDDSFNFAMFKQIYEQEPLESKLWLEKCGLIKNILVNGRQFPYRDTQFMDFDKFLVNKYNERTITV